jgi:putative membrane protein
MHGWYWDGGWWGGWVMMIGMVIFWAAVIFLIVWVVRSFVVPSRREQAPPAPSVTTQAPWPAPPPAAEALTILQRRYAAGEIDRAEFLEKMRDLGAPPGAGA